MTAHCERINCMAGSNTNRPGERDVLKDIWVLVRAGIRNLSNTWKTRRRQQRELHHLSDRDLKDIGMTRHDHGNRYNSHFWFV